MPKTIIDCTGRRLYRREVEGEPQKPQGPPTVIKREWGLPTLATTWQRIFFAIIAAAAIVTLWRM